MVIKKENLPGENPDMTPKKAIKTDCPTSDQKANQRLSNRRGRNSMTRYKAVQ
jgi:hypothetical protein